VPIEGEEGAAPEELSDEEKAAKGDVEVAGDR
jgi:hypothetical protein